MKIKFDNGDFIHVDNYRHANPVKKETARRFYRRTRIFMRKIGLTIVVVIFGIALYSVMDYHKDQ